MWRQKPVPFLMISAGIASVLALSLAGVFNYKPDTSPPFPYVPPPEGIEGNYIPTTVEDLEIAIEGRYGNSFDPQYYKGQSFVFQGISIPEGGLDANATDLNCGFVMFVPQDISDLMAFKGGERVDVLGIYNGPSEEFPSLSVFTNCYFLPVDLSPFPLAGGTPLVTY